MSTEQCSGWYGSKTASLCHRDVFQSGFLDAKLITLQKNDFFWEVIPSPPTLPRQVQCQLRIGKREMEQPLLLLSKHIFGPSSICHPVWGKDHSIAIWQCDHHDNYDLLRWLCLTNLFCWSSLVCYSLYFTGMAIVKPFSFSK